MPPRSREALSGADPRPLNFTRVITHGIYTWSDFTGTKRITTGQPSVQQQTEQLNYDLQPSNLEALMSVKLAKKNNSMNF